MKTEKKKKVKRYVNINDLGYIGYKLWSIKHLIIRGFKALTWFIFSRPKKTGYPYTVENYTNFKEVRDIIIKSHKAEKSMRWNGVGMTDSINEMNTTINKMVNNYVTNVKDDNSFNNSNTKDSKIVLDKLSDLEDILKDFNINRK